MKKITPRLVHPNNLKGGWADLLRTQLQEFQPLDIFSICKYNVITMITTIINIGNSRGIRIPKPILSESGLSEQVELRVKKGEIRIVPAPAKSTPAVTTLLLSERTLAADWDRPEEDKAWASLQ